MWSGLWIFNNNDNCKGISNVEVRWSRFNDNVNCYDNSYDNGINGELFEVLRVYWLVFRLRSGGTTVYKGAFNKEGSAG